jgi:DNA (cytosine-5)-methyltransferase 1
VPVVYAIQERAVSENLANGPQSKGYQPDNAYTLEARNNVQAVAFAMRGREHGAMPEVSGDHVSALRAASGGSTRDMLAFNTRQDPIHGPVADPLGTKDYGHGILRGSAVRRLTPRECERLQGFSDDYTAISHRGKPAADGPRYKALGNSMAVPVMRWIGERIAMVEAAQEAA